MDLAKIRKDNCEKCHEQARLIHHFAKQPIADPDTIDMPFLSLPPMAYAPASQGRSV